MPRVTVAILAYNRPEFLGEAIESVLDQTYTDFKLVIYDNCSEKDLKSVVDRYDDPRIVYHRNEKNLGQFGNAAQAIDLCDTEFLQYAHDDDHLFPWALEWLVEAMDRHPEVGMASALEPWHIMDSGDFMHYKNNRAGHVYKSREIADICCCKHTNISFSGMLVRPNILRAAEHNFRNDKGPMSDHYFVLEGNLKGIECFGYESPLIEYRIHQGSGSAESNYQGWVYSCKQCVDLMTEYICDKNKLIAYKDNMMSMAFMFSRISIDERSDFETFQNMWLYIEKIFNTFDRRAIFEKEMPVIFLGPYIIDIGNDIRPISDYFKRKNTLKNKGISISLMRELKWFLKYIVWQRWLGRSPK